MAAVAFHDCAQATEVFPDFATGLLGFALTVFPLKVAELSAQPRVFAEIPEMALERLRIAGEGLLVLSHGPGDLDDVPICLELGKG